MTDEDAPRDYADGARRGPATRVRRGRPDRRRRGRRRGEQARDPRPARVRPLARSRRRSPTAPRRRAAARPAPGITAVSLGDQADARGRGPDRSGSSPARAADADGALAAAVLPTALPLDSPLGRTAGVRNRIEVDATPVGHASASTGPGAGGAATSSAVLGDLIAIARGAGSTWGSATRRGRAPPSDAVSRPRGDVLDDGQRRPVPDR